MSIAWRIRSADIERHSPRDWEVRRIGDLVDLANGYPFPSDSFGPTGEMPLVRIRELVTHVEDFSTYVSGYIPRECILEDGDIVVGMDGDFNVVRWVRGTAALNQRLCRLRPRTGVDIRFIGYALPPILSIINDLTFSTTVKHLSSSDILTERLPLPPIAEQHRIADFLDAETSRIDALVAIQHQTKTILLERRAAKVFRAVTGGDATGRKESELSWVDSLPMEWKGVKLGHFARMGSGHTPSRSHPEWWEDCTIPWITTGEVSQVRDDRLEVLTETRECISEIGMANSAAELHPKGTVVLCRTASAGYSAVMGEDMATSQDFATWTCGPQLDPFFLLWCLRAMRSDLLGRLAMGSTHKTIYMPDLQALRVPLPPLGEQGQIVESIHASNAAIDVAIDTIDRQIALLAERRQALITAAVTGQIDASTVQGVAI